MLPFAEALPAVRFDPLLLFFDCEPVPVAEPPPFDFDPVPDLLPPAFDFEPVPVSDAT